MGFGSSSWLVWAPIFFFNCDTIKGCLTRVQGLSKKCRCLRHVRQGTQHLEEMPLLYRCRHRFLVKRQRCHRTGRRRWPQLLQENGVDDKLKQHRRRRRHSHDNDEQWHHQDRSVDDAVGVFISVWCISLIIMLFTCFFFG